MGIPQFHNEGPDQAGGSASMTVNFTGFTWSANDIIELVIATDGWVPVMTTANGFAFATDPQGNVASITTNGGVAGTNDCGMFVIYKRAVGSTTGTDPAPIFQAPSVQSGTSWCLQPNSFSGARTVGTPYHNITSSTVLTATTAVTSVAASSTLANCLFMPRVASTADDSAFNNWTMTGSAGPSGTGAPNTGWHNNNGNSCSFTGDEGGFAAATANVTATTTFATSTRQALVTLVMASVNEFELDETAPPRYYPPILPAPLVSLPQGDELAVTATAALDDDAPPQMWLAPLIRGVTLLLADDELPGTAAATIVDEDGVLVQILPAPPPVLRTAQPDDDFPGTAVTVLDEDGALAMPPSAPSSFLRAVPMSDDEIGTASGASVIEDEGRPAPLPSVPLVRPATLPDSDEYPTPVAVSLGVQAFFEKANTTTPNTGSITTRTVYPAWAPSTTYAIRTDDRVTNAGNTYECANSANTGTSASSGGPTTTPAPVTNGAITDGTTHWNFLAAGTGACDTQATGSMFLVSSGQGNDSASGTTPTDNKGNTYSIIGTKDFFAGFPQSSAATYVSALPATGGTGHTFTGTYGAGLDGGGDEKTLAAVEIIGGTTIIDHSQGEFSPNGSNVVTSASVTTTQAAVLVCFCWLNGGVHADGFLHTATPGSGFTALPLASGLLEIGNTAGQVQMCTIYKTVNTPGTYTASITTGAGLSEGSVMQLIAVQGISPPSIGVDDEAPPPLQIRVVPHLPRYPQATDELAITTVDDEVSARSVTIAPASAPLVLVAGDELAVTPGDDETQLSTQLSAPPVQQTALRADEDFAPLAQLDEDAAPAMPLPAPVVSAMSRVDTDDLPVTATTVVDEDSLLPIAPAPVLSTLPPRPDADELPTPVVATMIDEDGAPAYESPPVPAPITVLVQVDEFVAAIIPTLDEDSQLALMLTALAPPLQWLLPSDETVPGVIDETGILPGLQPAPPIPRWLVAEDDFQGSFVAPSSMIDETGLLPGLPWPPPQPGSYILAVDELAIPFVVTSLPKHVRILLSAGPAARIVNNAPSVRIVENPHV